MNGRGNPFVGRQPVTTPILIDAWSTSITVNPNPINCPKVSGALTLMTIPHTRMPRNNDTTSNVMKKPNSSPMIARMKSVWASGR